MSGTESTAASVAHCSPRNLTSRGSAPNPGSVACVVRQAHHALSLSKGGGPVPRAALSPPQRANKARRGDPGSQARRARLGHFRNRRPDL